MGCGRVRYTLRVIEAGDAASSDVGDEMGDIHGGETTRGWGTGRLAHSTCSSGLRRLLKAGVAFSAAREASRWRGGPVR